MNPCIRIKTQPFLANARKNTINIHQNVNKNIDNQKLFAYLIRFLAVRKDNRRQTILIKPITLKNMNQCLYKYKSGVKSGKQCCIKTKHKLCSKHKEFKLSCVNI